jgi:hypothetical protein
MVNARTGSEQNRKRTLTFTAPSLDDTAELRNKIAYRIIKNDIEYVLQKNLQLLSNTSMAAILSSAPKNSTTPKGTFEKHFKNLVREQGTGSSPMAAAQYLFSTMPYSEKRKLNISLNAMGIKSNQDMERLLHKWTAEVIKGIGGPAISRTKTREPEYER